MSHVESMVITIDGPAKCGKTETGRQITTEADYQNGVIPEILGANESGFPIYADTRVRLEALHDYLAWGEVIGISAGNVFRAAALYKALLSLDGETKTSFTDKDAGVIRDMLDTPGIADVLQNDPHIAVTVPEIGRMTGGEAVCSTIFADQVLEAFHRDGGSNLVVVDARNPVRHLRDNNALGRGVLQIPTSNVMPIYIDTPPEIAARWQAGDDDEKYAIELLRIQTRRHEDAIRMDHPVTTPTHLIHDYVEWLGQFKGMTEYSDVVHPFCWTNDADTNVSNVQRIGELLADRARDIGTFLFKNRQPAAQLG